MLLKSGDGSDQFTMTDPTSSLEVNSGGQALQIDNWRVDDGNVNTEMLDTLTQMMAIVLPFYFGTSGLVEWSKRRGAQGREQDSNRNDSKS